MRLGVLLFLGLAVTMIVPVHHAEAAPNKFISITRDNTCKKTDCISIKELLTYDNSTKKVSGEFWKKGSDYYRKPGIKNSHNYYTQFQDKIFVFVDPPSETMVRSKQIILVTSLGEYIPAGHAKKTEINSMQDTRFTWYGVYVDPKCQTAKVGVKQNVDLAKIILHMAADCKTPLDNKIFYNTTKSNIKYCGQECQHQKWLKEALEKSKKNLLRPT